MNLTNKSRTLISQLCKTDFFSKCGTPVHPEDGEKYLFVDKSNAIKLLLSSHWDDTLLEAKNGCTMSLPQDQLKNWNAVVGEVTSATADIVDVASTTLCEYFDITDGHVQKLAKRRVKTSFVVACVELEYHDHLKPGFFNELCYIYINGFLPCGFEGEFPNGKLMVH